MLCADTPAGSCCRVLSPGLKVISGSSTHPQHQITSLVSILMQAMASSMASSSPAHRFHSSQFTSSLPPSPQLSQRNHPCGRFCTQQKLPLRQGADHCKSLIPIGLPWSIPTKTAFRGKKKSLNTRTLQQALKCHLSAAICQDFHLWCCINPLFFRTQWWYLQSQICDTSKSNTQNEAFI